MRTYSAIPRAQYREQPRRMPRCLSFERYALGFNGSTNYVDCGNDESLNITDAITIEAWVKPFDWGENDYGRIVDKGKFAFALNNPNLRFYGIFSSHNGVWVTPFSELNKWSHVVVVYDFNPVNDPVFYINGEEKSVSEIETPSGTLEDHSSDNLLIGNRQELDRTFNGLTALVRIYGDYALTPEEVRWNMLNYHNPVHPEKLVLWLPMEEGSGLTVYDKSGHGNNGSLLPADDPPTWERVRQYEIRASV